MKKSLIKKLALLTGTAIAFSSFALLSTGCSKDEKEDKKDKKDKKVEETEETEAEETEAPVETTEAEETDAPVETEIDDIDLGFELFDISTIEDAELKAIADEFLAKNYMFFSFEDMGEELPEGCLEGFYGMDSSFTAMMLAAKFDSKEAAEAYLMEEMGFADEAFEDFEKTETETEDGTVYTMSDETMGLTITITITNSGILLLDETMG